MRPKSWSYWLPLIGLLLGTLCTNSRPLIGQETAGSTEAEVTDVAPSEDEPTEREKKASTTVGLMMISLIGLSGIFLIIWVLLYGRWFRRVTRQRTAPTPAPDPLWHLKNADRQESPFGELQNGEPGDGASGEFPSNPDRPPDESDEPEDKSP